MNQTVPAYQILLRAQTLRSGRNFIMKLEMLVSEKLGKAISESSNQEIYQALMAVVQDMAEQKESNAGKKKVYYVSAEFLIGKLLSNNMINLGIYEDVRKMLAANGKDIC